MRFKLKRKTVDINLKALFINDFFGGDGLTVRSLLKR